MHLLEEADRYFRTMEAYLTPPEQRARMMDDETFTEDAAGEPTDDTNRDAPPVDLIDDELR